MIKHHIDEIRIISRPHLSCQTGAVEVEVRQVYYDEVPWTNKTSDKEADEVCVGLVSVLGLD